MPRLLRQLLQVLELSAAIALAERMDVIDVADDNAGFTGEFRG